MQHIAEIILPATGLQAPIISYSLKPNNKGELDDRHQHKVLSSRPIKPQFLTIPYLPRKLAPFGLGIGIAVQISPKVGRRLRGEWVMA